MPPKSVTAPEPSKHEVVYTPDEATAVLEAVVPEKPVVVVPAFTPPMAPKKEPFMKEDVPVASRVEEPEVTEEDTVDNVESNAPVEKPMYDAICATCETPIQVPFVPDGSRPTFCKDCLRDYQRATAKARNEIEQKQVRETPRPASAPSPAPARPVVKRPAYVPTEQPMSLAQTRHIEPKKFKALKKRQPDLGGIRALIDTAKRES